MNPSSRMDRLSARIIYLLKTGCPEHMLKKTADRMRRVEKPGIFLRERTSVLKDFNYVQLLANWGYTALYFASSLVQVSFQRWLKDEKRRSSLIRILVIWMNAGRLVVGIGCNYGEKSVNRVLMAPIS